MRFLFLLAASVSLYAQSCTYTATPNSFMMPAGSPGAGPSDKFAVATQTNCRWTATAGVSWIHITNSQTYIGSSSVTFTLDPNTSTQIRTGTVTVGDDSTHQTVSFTQVAGNCNYQVTPSSVNLPVTGGGGTLQVTAGCAWTASASASWIALTPPVTTTLGNGSVAYTVAANTCVAGRTGAITLGSTGLPNPPALTITEDGSQSNLTVSPSSASFGAAAAAGRFNVNTGDGCPWSASPPDVNWLQITANSGSGNGPGAITFSLTANAGPPRTGHITVGTQIFTVTQANTGTAAPVLTGVFNNASGAFGPISPGEIIALFGTSLGPAAPVLYSGSILNSLGGVQVLIGGNPVPLLYVSATQINAVVPYGITGPGPVSVQVQYQGQVSNTAGQTVQSATPGLYAVDASGHGPGAILNSDYKTNSNVNPAARGSVVMIYATGGGITDPAGTDGATAPLAEPFPRLTLPVAVTIGGAPAQVLYAGGAPGLVNGLVQINAVVPPGIATGPSVPVLLTIGGVQSQTTITMAVQ